MTHINCNKSAKEMFEEVNCIYRKDEETGSYSFSEWFDIFEKLETKHLYLGE